MHLTWTRPAEGPEYCDARADTKQERAAFTLAAAPRGNGNPDVGWPHRVAYTAVEGTREPGAPEDLDVFAVRHGSGGASQPAFEHTPDGPTVRTKAFTAVLGAPAGDQHGSRCSGCTPGNL